MLVVTKDGNGVRRVRDAVGLTQERFAAAVGVTVSTVNRWEHGHACPSRLAWQALFQMLHEREVPYRADGF